MKGKQLTFRTGAWHKMQKENEGKKEKMIKESNKRIAKFRKIIEDMMKENKEIV